MDMNIRPYTKEDLTSTAEVHRAAFIRERLSREWIEFSANAYPKSLLFVAEAEHGGIAGYILWTLKSGYRPEVVVELEQLAVHPTYQGKGIGTKLVKGTLPLVQEEMRRRNCQIKHVLVTTRADNFAQQLYRKTLGAEVEATLTNLHSADEVIMVARNIALE